MAVKGNCTIQKAAEVMNDNSRVTHSLKKIKRAKDISSTPLWTSSGTRLALTSFAEMIVSTNLDKSRGYVAVQTSATAWSIIHKSHLGCSLGPYHVEGTPIPRFRRVYKVTLHFNKYLCCNCHFFSRMLLPCCHILHIVGDVSSNMCHIRWHKSYMFHYERQDEVSGTLKELAKFIPIGVPVEGTTFMLELLSSENNSFPCKVQGISDENYETFVNMLHSMDDLHSFADDDTSANLNNVPGLSQELFMSPTRAMMEHGKDCNSSPSYRDCLKAFNFVFNYFQNQRNGSHKFLSAIWDVYNSSIASTSASNNTTGNVISFPEVQTTSVNIRKRTAGYL